MIAEEQPADTADIPGGLRLGSRRVQWLAAGAAFAVVLAAVLAVGSGAHLSRLPQSARASGPVVLIMVEDLDWASAPPQLSSFAHGTLSIHSAGSEQSAADGYLTVGKGRRARSLAVVPDLTSQSPPGSHFTIGDWKDMQAHDAAASYGGRLGSFGSALEGSKRTWALITEDPLAALAVADHHGVVRHATWGSADAVRAALHSGVDIVVTNAESPVDLPALLDAADGHCRIVASVSSPTDYTHLGVIATSSECGLGTDGLVSGSTRQPPFSALVDVAPTVLDRSGLRRPTSMVGVAVQASRPVSTAELAAEDRRAHETLSAHDGFTWFFIGLSSIAALYMIVTRRRPPLPFAAAVAALPVSTFLIMAVPWWSRGAWAADLASLAIALAIGAVAAVVFRGRPEPCFAAVAWFTVAVLVTDAIRGGSFELDAPFGNSPTIAGRFDGIGNIAFGFAMGAMLVACAIWLHRSAGRALPWVVFACGCFALAGAPSLGDKVGLVPVWVPAAGVLLISWRSGKVRVRQLAILGALAVAVLGAFAIYDLSRGAQTQSHLGRFLTSGDTLHTISRKASSMLRSLRGDPLRLTLPLPLVALFQRRHALLEAAWLRSLLLGLGTAVVLGTLLNDSGIAVGAAVVATSWPALVFLTTDAEVSRSEATRPGRPEARPPRAPLAEAPS